MNNLLIADLHLHSKYSRAVSQRMDLTEIGTWATKKGIDLVATGDWTHPIWFKEIQSSLVEREPGFFQLKKSDININPKLRFLLSTEVSNIYSQNGRGHRIHLLILSPNLSVCEKVQNILKKSGVNLASDGRPIMGLSVPTLLELLWTIDENIIVIPAHIWTPWFSLFGSSSGFDSTTECFGKYQDKIFAFETGLSSDPTMNWSIKELKNKSLVSFSDAHSGQKLGREATVFKIKNNKQKCDFFELAKALKQDKNSNLELSFTIEFFPEEGKYHYSGHRLCAVRLTPEEILASNNLCPKCHKPLTIGVMDRVQALTSHLILEKELLIKESLSQAKLLFNKNQERPFFTSIVPLLEIISEIENVATPGKKVIEIYEDVISKTGNEFNCLIFEPLNSLKKKINPKLFTAITNMRQRKVKLDPGFDGVFGKISINVPKEKEDRKEISDITQKSLF